MSPVDSACAVSEISPYLCAESFVKFSCVYMRGQSGSVLEISVSGLKFYQFNLKIDAVILRDLTDVLAMLPSSGYKTKYR